MASHTLTRAASTMAFYGADKKAVVIELGSAFVKVGLAGESRPRHFLPTKFTLGNGKVLEIELAASAKRPTQEEWCEALELWLSDLFFRKLLVTPKDRRIVIVENLSLPTSFRDALGFVLFQRYSCSALLLVPVPVAALAALEIATGLVLDLGHAEARVVPVVDSYPLLSWQVATPLAGRKLLQNLGRLLSRYARRRFVADARGSLLDLPDLDDDGGLNDASWPLSPSDMCGPWSEAWLQQALPRLAFVALAAGDPARASLGADGHAAPPPQPIDFSFALSPSELLDVRGGVRAAVAEVLFQNNNAADWLSLPEALLEALVLCAPDIRGTVSQNIVVCGGLALLPGMLARLRFEVDTLARSKERYKGLAALVSRFRYVPSPFLSNAVGWLGGGVYGAVLEHTPLSSVTAEDYADTGLLPDWSRLSYRLGDEMMFAAM